ncbi:TIGR03621 family F420-dependent LLM class oxidoreductase [Pseudonocardia sp. WMMC193]|uniref:TIGR03621 family F420-dependent LLM class oxidoreductase n=1 Tax=Pseudonocardia sp. WMMC193 TaxID=2911965 RepID=UPI001EFFC38C|nr:TIGR03621 family F420-dependent LLM class oxidoreductase [Pseudonocardia sp. WMMC193]MCF7549516.1 TIGR03621 family F420-dependent LLM class oxidoreductase [Pseudonocardia sp. WMMC193]
MHPFQFGLTSTGADGPWLPLARRVEDLGFSTLQVPQHFSLASVPPLVALAMAAGATTGLRVGTLVLDNEAAHPAVVARDGAWLARETGGRFELGIGAGWLAADHTMLGGTWRAAPERVDRLAESLELIRACWAGSTHHDGEHYVLTDLPEGTATDAPPPVLIGGGGARVLALAARHADIVGIAPDMRTGRIGRAAARTTTRELVAEKASRVRAAAERPVELQVTITAVIDADDTARLERTAATFGVPPEEVHALPSVLVGSTAEIADTLRARREETGISYVSVPEPMLERIAPVVAELAGT